MTHPYTDLKEALAKATEGPWESGRLHIFESWHVKSMDGQMQFEAWGSSDNDENDAAFIALARNRLSELLADYERMREALEGLLNRYDPENPGDAMAPDGGCIECTVGTVPNNLNTGLCPMHRARAALKEKPHD